MINWEQVAEEYAAAKQQETEAKERMFELRQEMKENLPDGVDNIQTSLGRFTRYKCFRKWSYSDETEAMMQKEKDDETATKEVTETVAFYFNKN